MSYHEESKKIIKNEWLQLLVMAVTVSGLFLWNHNEMHDNQRDTRNLVDAIRQDMNDFHGRLERQDAEFKCGWLLLEEKILNRKE